MDKRVGLWKDFPVEFRCWSLMRQRCYNKNAPEYHNYGERGITVCDQWLEKGSGFHVFLQDMGRRPDKNYSIERRDTNGNYEPANCYWATKKEQNNNTRRNILLTHAGKTQTLRAWSEELHMDYDRLHARYRYGWSPENILRVETGIYTKERKHNHKSALLTYEGETLTLTQWSRKLDMPYEVIRARSRYGWDTARIFNTPIQKRRHG